MTIYTPWGPKERPPRLSVSGEYITQYTRVAKYTNDIIRLIKCRILRKTC
jgi:hypothetical protein